MQDGSYSSDEEGPFSQYTRDSQEWISRLIVRKYQLKEKLQKGEEERKKQEEELGRELILAIDACIVLCKHNCKMLAAVGEAGLPPAYKPQPSVR